MKSRPRFLIRQKQRARFSAARGRAFQRRDFVNPMGRNRFCKSSGRRTSYRVALPEAAMDARLDALNHAARNGKDFSEFMSAIAQMD